MIDLKKALAARKEPTPLLNETFPQHYQQLITHPSSYADVEKLIRLCPEAIGIITALKTDIQGTGVVFEGGPNKIKQAREFYEMELIKQQIDAAITDCMMFGDGYLWVGNINEFLKKPEVIRRIDKTLSKFDEGNVMSLKVNQLLDEDRLVDVSHVPAATMNIDHDGIEVVRYRQIVNHKEIIFDRKNVIHFKYMNLSGKVHGFSPFLSALGELQTIGYIKDYAATWFKDGAIPDWLFIFKNENPNTPNYNTLVQQTQKYKHPLTKRGNMILTGDVQAQPMNTFNKDMEFRQLYVTLVGSIASGFNLPVSRLLQVMGKDVKSGSTSSDFEMDGYFSMIEEKQDYWERLLNSQLWEPFFGVTMRFKRGYMQKTIRKMQALSQAMPSGMMMLQNKFPVTDEYLFELFNIEEKYRKGSFDEVRASIEEKQQVEKEAQLGGKPQPLKDSETIAGPAKQSEAERKRKVARNMGQNS